VTQPNRKTGFSRARSTFTLKAVDEEQRTFEGIATTPRPDLENDQIVSEGAVFDLPIPLWEHGKGAITDPIGQIVSARVTPDGIYVRGRLQKPGPDYPQQLADDLQRSWVLLRDGLTRGLSVGFIPIESTPISGTTGYRYERWRFIELSLVKIPAQPDARVESVKATAAKEPSRIVRLAKPGIFRLPNPPPRKVNGDAFSLKTGHRVPKAGVFRVPDSIRRRLGG